MVGREKFPRCSFCDRPGEGSVLMRSGVDARIVICGSCLALGASLIREKDPALFESIAHGGGGLRET
jgi:hypothetical protein